MVALTFAVAILAAAEDPGPSFSWAIPIITSLIVLVGTIVGFVVNKQTAGQRLAFERAQWEAAEAERRWKADRDEEERRRTTEREAEERRRAAQHEEEERARAHATEVQTAVEAKCGECMDEVRRLMDDLDAATDRLLTAHRLIGQKDARIETLETELRNAKDAP